MMHVSKQREQRYRYPYADYTQYHFLRGHVVLMRIKSIRITYRSLFYILYFPTKMIKMLTLNSALHNL